MLRISYPKLTIYLASAFLIGACTEKVVRRRYGYGDSKLPRPRSPTEYEMLRGGGQLIEAPVGSTTNTPAVDGRPVFKEVAALSNELYRGNAECGRYDLVIGILTAATEKGRKLRQVLRSSWFQLADQGPGGVTIRFLLSTPPNITIDDGIALEISEFRDILVLPIDAGSRKGYSGSGPSNVLERVRSFFRWAGSHCSYRYILKTDDDCYVAVDRLLSRIQTNEFPTERLYFGRFLAGMAGRNKEGKPDADNYQNHAQFSTYAGAGYLITPDVAAYLGNPGLPVLFHRVEDRGIGVLLDGMNVTYLKGEKEFQPWGQCFQDSLWIHHFQKEPALMIRRYERARDGKSICGEGFPPGQVCALAEQGKILDLKCKKKLEVIKKVVFASYGRHLSSAPGPCKEGTSALTIDDTCHHKNSEEIVQKACIGKHECNSITNTVDKLGADPCPGEHWDKRFLVVVECGS